MCEIYDDGDNAAVYHVRERRAQKPHRCHACGAIILPGERYAYGSGVFDGRGFSEKACLACAKLRKDFGDAHQYYAAFSELAERLHECVAEGDAESLSWQNALFVLRARRDEAHVQCAVTVVFSRWLVEQKAVS